jgi:pseudoazurin
MRIVAGLFAAFLGMLLVSTPAMAKEWQVKMLNKGPEGTMVFSPAYLKIAPGDTVKFIATDKGHNAEMIAGMLPAGATMWRGKINEEIVVKFTVPGLYGYKCLPHYPMGMVGLIQVGNASNKPAMAAAAAKLPGLAKIRMTALLAKAK